MPSMEDTIVPSEVPQAVSSLWYVLLIMTRDVGKTRSIAPHESTVTVV